MDEVQKLNAVCFLLIAKLIETEAETMTIKQVNVTKESVSYGDFEITVKRIAK